MFKILHPIVYVTRDLERALGLDLETKNYFIITNNSSFAKQLASGRKNVLLIKSDRKLDTRELLQNPLAKRFIDRLQASIMVFKNTLEIERICAQNKWPLLNPDARLSAKVEEKISQVEWLGELKKFLPPHQVVVCKNARWSGHKFILQFNRAHTGRGTVLVESPSQLRVIQRQFPNRPVRITDYIQGPVFTNNNIVWGKKSLLGNINYQITGLTPFTDQPFATIGNDWAMPAKLLNTAQVRSYQQMARAIGRKLAQAGWKGLYGVDVVKDPIAGKLYLLEINARQPASTAYESQLQRQQRVRNQLTTFEAHCLALLEAPNNDQELVGINDGAQVVKRVIEGKPNKITSKSEIKRLSQWGFDTIEYDNAEAGADSLRIQFPTSLMTGHGEFNEAGRQLIILLH